MDAGPIGPAGAIHAVGIMTWPSSTPGRILAVVASVQIAIAALALVVADNGPRLLPGQRDDDPWGNLYRMDRSGAVVWILLGFLALLSALSGRREAIMATVAAWSVTALVVIAVSATDSDLFGWSRPSNAAWALAIIAAAVVSLIEPNPTS